MEPMDIQHLAISIYATLCFFFGIGLGLNHLVAGERLKVNSLICIILFWPGFFVSATIIGLVAGVVALWDALDIPIGGDSTK